MRRYNVGTICVLNRKAHPLPEHNKSWVVPGRRVRIRKVSHENKRRGNRWYEVELIAKRSKHVLGVMRLPSNWLDLEEEVHYFEVMRTISVSGSTVTKDSEIRIPCGAANGQADNRWSQVTCKACLAKRGEN
jgi:hypothetical protein